MQAMMHQYGTDLLRGLAAPPPRVAANKGKPLTWLFSAE